MSHHVVQIKQSHRDLLDFEVSLLNDKLIHVS